MSMTVWLVSEDRKHSVEEDLNALFHLQEALDELCAELGVTPLGDFFDDFELRQDFDPEDFGDMDETDDIDGLQDMLDAPEGWYAAADLLATVEALVQHLDSHSPDFSAFDEQLTCADVLQECRLIIPALEAAAAAQQPVHLQVLG
ncbi:hypothetical protein L1281_000763 [Neisseria sp. HSC-16F19]|nr:hypothetical protein [Neisseria sp. HSC-16F19]MCP2040183.1 hypothetical protein [Neisseria sp. HSC-16F19]